MALDLKTRLQQDATAALRARAEGRERLSVLRLALSEIKNAEIDRRGPLEEDAVLAVIARGVRQRQETASEARRLGREDAAAKAEAEIVVLREYLPEAIDPDALEVEVDRAIAEVGAQGPRDLGKVMTLLIPRLRGRAGGEAIQAAVRRRLGG